MQTDRFGVEEPCSDRQGSAKVRKCLVLLTCYMADDYYNDSSRDRKCGSRLLARPVYCPAEDYKDANLSGADAGDVRQP